MESKPINLRALTDKQLNALVLHWIESGELPATRKGDRWVIDKDDWMDYMAKHSFPPESKLDMKGN